MTLLALPDGHDFVQQNIKGNFVSIDPLSIACEINKALL